MAKTPPHERRRQHALRVLLTRGLIDACLAYRATGRLCASCEAWRLRMMAEPGVYQHEELPKCTTAT